MSLCDCVLLPLHFHSIVQYPIVYYPPLSHPMLHCTTRNDTTLYYTIPYHTMIYYNHGGRSWSGPDPKGGGYPPPLYRPQNGCTEQWVLWAPEAPEILF